MCKKNWCQGLTKNIYVLSIVFHKDSNASDCKFIVKTFACAFLFTWEQSHEEVSYKLLLCYATDN
jgi:hypothetical protein